YKPPWKSSSLSICQHALLPSTINTAFLGGLTFFPPPFAETTDHTPCKRSKSVLGSILLGWVVPAPCPGVSALVCWPATVTCVTRPPLKAKTPIITSAVITVLSFVKSMVLITPSMSAATEAEIVPAATVCPATRNLAALIVVTTTEGGVQPSAAFSDSIAPNP